jgi:hypothetical protein
VAKKSTNARESTGSFDSTSIGRELDEITEPEVGELITSCAPDSATGAKIRKAAKMAYKKSEFFIFFNLTAIFAVRVVDIHTCFSIQKR